MTRGAAMGHGFEIDDTTLKQVADGINRRKTGVKMRLGHPGYASDAVGTVLGRLNNARVEGDRVRADVSFGKYANSLPGKGNARDYLMGMAEEHPDLVGLSIVAYFKMLRERMTRDCRSRRSLASITAARRRAGRRFRRRARRQRQRSFKSTRIPPARRRRGLNPILLFQEIPQWIRNCLRFSSRWGSTPKRAMPMRIQVPAAAPRQAQPLGLAEGR
jgi:hypothetical protein